MKYGRKRAGALLLSGAMVLSAMPVLSAGAEGLNGVQPYEDGNWYYWVDGQVDWNYTGLASNELGWWYIRNGVLDWSYSGFASNEAGWWYVSNGAIDFEGTGIAANEAGTWYYQNGRVAFEFTGTVNIDGTDYNIVGGQVVEGNLNGVCLGGDGNWYYYVNGQIDRSFTGLASNEAGWWYIREGVLDWSYTGLASNEAGWWYVEGGAINFNSTGLAVNEAGIWYYQNSRVAFEFTGTVNIGGVDYNIVGGQVAAGALNGVCLGGDGNWYYYVNGQIDYGYTGLASNEAGWWYINNGVFDWSFTGLVGNEAGWWYVKNGAIDFGATGLATNEVGTWYYQNGRVAFEYTGIVNIDGKEYNVVNGKVSVNVLNGICAAEDGSWHYYVNGQIDKNYTGLASNDAGWWYVKNGDIDFASTGIVSHNSKLWYYRDSRVATEFTGEVVVDGKKYSVVNGEAKEAGNTGEVTDGTYQAGVKATGELEQNGVYLILSSVNPDYALTVVESPTTNGGYNLVMSKLTGDESQKFKVYRAENGLYSFMSMKYLDENGVSPDSKWMIGQKGGGFDPNAAGNAVNVDVASLSKTEGVDFSWVVEEGAAGEYALKVNRTDYAFYLWVPGQIAEGANVQAGGTQNMKMTLNFVAPYTKTLEDGTYRLNLAEDGNAVLGMADSSVKDYKVLTASAATAGADQLFDIRCTNAQKGTYTIQNNMSKKYLQIADGSIALGTVALQVEKTGALAQEWYIQKRMDGSYSLINAQSHQMLTVAGNNVSQGIGRDQANQKFTITAAESETETIEAGVYRIGGKNYRFSYVGNGYYHIYALGSGYCVASGNSMAYEQDANLATGKWRVTKAGDKYSIQSVATGKYMDANGGLTAAQTSIEAVNVTDSITDYTQKYDLSTLSTLDSAAYDTVQVVKRMKSLGLQRSDFMNPVSRINEIEARVAEGLKGLPKEVVQYTGTSVAELNDFMAKNQGKIVQLTQDIQVKPEFWDNAQRDGSIRIPPNVVLDGNGHELKMACSAEELPTAGIVFFYNDGNNGWKEVISSNCGVINLKSEIPYEHNTLNTWGASKIWIENNTFLNAGYNAILINDKDHGKTSIGLIKDNTLGNTKIDTLGVYGNNDSIVISGNTIYNSEEYGLNVSCLRDGSALLRVEDELDGPHDIVVKDNEVSGTKKCAMYYLGAYQVYVTDNYLHDTQLEGVCFDSGCIGCYFAGNTVERTSQDGGLPGVSIDNGIYNIVDNNIVRENGSAGIKIVRAGYGSIIVNNTCYDNNTKVNSIKGNLGIAIEVEPVDPIKEAEYVNILDASGSDANVVYNNVVYGGHYQGIAVSKDVAETGAKNVNNVVRYNKVTADSDYPLVDFSSFDNDLRNNVITK